MIWIVLLISGISGSVHELSIPADTHIEVTEPLQLLSEQNGSARVRILHTEPGNYTAVLYYLPLNADGFIVGTGESMNVEVQATPPPKKNTIRLRFRMFIRTLLLKLGIVAG